MLIVAAADPLSAAGTIVTIACAALGVIFTVGAFIISLRTSVAKIETRMDRMDEDRKSNEKVLENLTTAINGLNTNFSLVRQSIDTHLLPVINTLLNASPSAPIPFNPHLHGEQQHQRRAP